MGGRALKGESECGEGEGNEREQGDWLARDKQEDTDDWWRRGTEKNKYCENVTKKPIALYTNLKLYKYVKVSKKVIRFAFYTSMFSGEYYLFQLCKS